MSDMSATRTFVIAVSGGVDSMVLLDALINNRLSELVPNYQLPTTNYQLIVAHFDHGIRADSGEDEELVREAAQKNKLIYEHQRVQLGENTSEETARTARYNFLRQVCKKYKGILITAHHQDDVLETMIINLMRGTSWRGLAPMNGSSDIVRPLLKATKAQILDYAQSYGVKWREDSTNRDQRYLRNYVRLTLLPRMELIDVNAKQTLLSINTKMTALQKEIATELQKIIPPIDSSSQSYTIPRYQLIMLPSPVAAETIYQLLTNLDPQWHPNSVQVERALHFVKTGSPHKQLQVSGNLTIKLTVRQAVFSAS